MPAGSVPPAARPPALLVLEDGRSFRGRAFGAVGETFGEAVFATGMSGYQETLTDPSYHRQVVVATAPHIGNTGWNDEDDESSRIWVAGYVVRDAARVPSSWRSRRSLDDELRAQNVVGMCDVDTRALTRHLRERGAMRVGVSSVETDPAALLERVRAQPEMTGAFLADQVSTDETYVIPAEGEARFRVVAVDLGIKSMTPHRMAERGIEVHVVPATATIEQVRALQPDGVFFSNGPGDPAATGEYAIPVIQEMLETKKPLFGICLGHQLLALAVGGKTSKMFQGHRGANHPVKRLADGKVEITSMNHGFAVERDGMPEHVRETHVSLFDGSNCGIELTDRPAFSVQYHPEASPGPQDSYYLFEKFVGAMK